MRDQEQVVHTMKSDARMNPRNRLVAIDVFRGATVAGMLLVNNPGSWSYVYPPLLHADWHGWTPTDLIFPFFLFVVGITTEISLQRQTVTGSDARAVFLRIVRRGLLIVALGLLLNWFPFFTWGDLLGSGSSSPWERVVHRWEHLRWSGVLQRIGLVYLVAAPLVWLFRARLLLVITALLLAGYATVLLALPVPGSGAIGAAAIAHPDTTIAAWSDRLLLTRQHIWRGGAWDPEGPLSTIPAIGTTLFGAILGRYLTAAPATVRRLWHIVLAGAVGMLAGLLWSQWLPINKNLWTSSYVLFTAGMAAVMVAAATWIVDVRRVRRGTGFFVTFGLNPLVAFVGSGVMTRLTTSLIRIDVEGRTRTLHSLLHETLFVGWLPQRAASLAWAVTFVLVWYVILRMLERRGWIIRV